MRSLLISEYEPAFFIQGFNLQSEDGSVYGGKLGRNELQLLPSIESIPDSGDLQVIYVGVTATEGQFRPGDILMVGQDLLVDQAFRALDEMDHRGIVVSLAPGDDPNQIYIQKDDLKDKIMDWKHRKIPFLCLLTGEQPETESKTKLITLIRRLVTISSENQATAWPEATT